MRRESHRPTRLQRAIPHLIGLYAVGGLLTGASTYNRLPTLPLNHNERMTMASQAAVAWPFVLTVRAMAKARRAVFE